MKTKYLRRMFALLLAVSMIFINTVAFSAEVDANKKGSVTLYLKELDSSTAVTNAGVTIYKVADADVSNDGIVYMFTDDFSRFEGSAQDLTDNTKYVSELENFVKSNNIVGNEKISDNSGCVKFENLSVGCYLLMQTKGVGNYADFKTFFINIPSDVSGDTLYDVVAEPKITVDIKPTVPTQDSTTGTDAPVGDKLPQTGQVNWPIPLFFILGLVFIISGIPMYNFRRGKSDD